jgi:superfamily II DNA/RNA helicase
VHRIGRTGRAGAKGEAISLFTSDEERYLLDIEKLVKNKIPRGELALPPRARSSSGGGAARREPRTVTRWNPAAAPVDEFFLRPYEPAATKPAEPAPASRPTPARKSVGVLLGGAKRPSL